MKNILLILFATFFLNTAFVFGGWRNNTVSITKSGLAVGSTTFMLVDRSTVSTTGANMNFFTHKNSGLTDDILINSIQAMSYDSIELNIGFISYIDVNSSTITWFNVCKSTNNKPSNVYINYGENKLGWYGGTSFYLMKAPSSEDSDIDTAMRIYIYDGVTNIIPAVGDVLLRAIVGANATSDNEFSIIFNYTTRDK